MNIMQPKMKLKPNCEINCEINCELNYEGINYGHIQKFY
jgi:hypothetical protein